MHIDVCYLLILMMKSYIFCLISKETFDQTYTLTEFLKSVGHFKNKLYTYRSISNSIVSNIIN